ncbi:uncharacterized protein LOC121803783 [Salvia splendens]|uniref:uncharacterized protein LOC121803783 n=1 Tax=Salvia splendens TaxID=180675 RepID=UPI001C2616F6|nr:uncharacterized protein LOC121803783 [Salvia splendens]
MVDLGHGMKLICAFVYCDPKNEDQCKGTEMGLPLRLITDEMHLARFLSVATTYTKMVHVYAIEVTVSDAILRKKRRAFEKLWKVPSGVVIEELEEAEPVIRKPKPKSRKQSKPRKPERRLIGWYERDIEFEEYMVKCLADYKEKTNREDVEASKTVAVEVNCALNVDKGMANAECALNAGVSSEECVGGVGGIAMVADGACVQVDEGIEVDVPHDKETMMDGDIAQVGVVQCDIVHGDAVHCDGGSTVGIEHDNETTDARACPTPRDNGKGIVVLQKDVYIPCLDELLTNCPLRNDDVDDEVDEFISLYEMCRDEQLFSSYFDDIFQQENQIPSGCGGWASVNEACEGNLDGESVLEVVENEVCDGEEFHDLPKRGVGNQEETSATQVCEGTTRQQKQKKQGRRPAETMQIVDPYEAELLQDYLHCPLHDNSASDEERDENLALYAIFTFTGECPTWNVGDVFKSRNFFRDVLRQYAVMSRRPMELHRNDKTKLRARCKGNGCKWFVSLAKNSAYNTEDYILKKVHKEHAHTCTEIQKNKWISAKWLGEQFMEKIKANPHIPIQVIRQCVDGQFGVLLSRMTAYRAREAALEGIYGKTGRQYGRLFDYKRELLRTHPDSTVEILYESNRDEGSTGPNFENHKFGACLLNYKSGVFQHYHEFGSISKV